jgi:hypothetical protein
VSIHLVADFCLLCISPIYSDLLSSEVDGKTATYILSTIREEEQQTEMLKRQTASVAAIGAADAIDTSGVAAEQSFNREQVQEQEQVRLFFSAPVLWMVVCWCWMRCHDREKSHGMRFCIFPPLFVVIWC